MPATLLLPMVALLLAAAPGQAQASDEAAPSSRIAPSATSAAGVPGGLKVFPASAVSTPAAGAQATRSLQRFSQDATLRALALTDTSDNAVLFTEAFSRTKYAYTANVDATTAAVKVTATVNHPDAYVRVIGTADFLQRNAGRLLLGRFVALTSGSASDAMNLSYGANTITVQGEAEAINTQDYTITVNRALPVLEVQHAAATVAEGVGYLSLRLESTAPNVMSGTVSYAAGTASPAGPADDLGRGLQTSFRSSQSADHVLITVPIVDDTLNEPDETFTVTINSGTGYTVGPSDTQTLTIEDDDAPAAPGALEVTAGDARLVVVWTKPAGPVTGYQMRYKEIAATDQAAVGNDPSTGWVTRTPSGTGVTAEVAGLTNGTAYAVQVRATDGTDAGGYGVWSGTQSGTPSAPTTGERATTRVISPVISPRDDASLSALAAGSSTRASGPFSSLVLSPAFAAARTHYTATVPNATTHVRLTPETSDRAAAVKVGKGGSLAPVASGSASAAIALTVGANAIRVEVVAADGQAMRTYIATITRRAPARGPSSLRRPPGGAAGGGAAGGGAAGGGAPPQQQVGFADVPESSPHAASIDALRAADITQGCSQEPLRYCPNQPVTRAQMATFLTRALNLTAPNSGAGFADVPESSPHAASIDALRAADITQGCSQEPLRYCPDQPVTRAQMATFLTRALNLP